MWDGISVINLGRKAMWLWPLPVYVGPVVLESPGRCPGMHRSPVTLKRGYCNSRPQLCVIHKWTHLWLITVIRVVIRQDIHSQSALGVFSVWVSLLNNCLANLSRGFDSLNCRFLLIKCFLLQSLMHINECQAVLDLSNLQLGSKSPWKEGLGMSRLGKWWDIVASFLQFGAFQRQTLFLLIYIFISHKAQSQLPSSIFPYSAQFQVKSPRRGEEEVRTQHFFSRIGLPFHGDAQFHAWLWITQSVCGCRVVVQGANP